MSTFCGRKVNPVFNAYRKKETRRILGPSCTYAAIKTEDATGKISSLSYEFKGNLTSKLLTEGYLRIAPDIFIGEKDFVVIYKYIWRL